MGHLLSSSVILTCLLTGCKKDVLPSWITWNGKEEALPENPGLFEGIVSLRDRQAEYRQDTCVWKSDPEWLVSDFLIDDIDRDGWPEVLLSVWVKGQYGDQHPIWEDPQTSSYTQRLFVFDIKEDHLEPQWMSSQMRPQYTEWEIIDHQIILTDPEGRTSFWEWQGRGFVRTDDPAE